MGDMWNERALRIREIEAAAEGTAQKLVSSILKRVPLSAGIFDKDMRAIESEVEGALREAGRKMLNACNDTMQIRYKHDGY